MRDVIFIILMLVLIIVTIMCGGCATEPVNPASSGATSTSTSFGVAEGSAAATGTNIERAIKDPKAAPTLLPIADIQNRATIRAIQSAQASFQWFQDQYNGLFNGLAQEKLNHKIDVEKWQASYADAAWIGWRLYFWLKIWVVALVISLLAARIGPLLGGWYGPLVAKVGLIGSHLLSFGLTAVAAPAIIANATKTQ